MPSDDLVLNVRQIAGYPPAASVSSIDSVLIQRGGLGGPYLSVAADDFVSTALSGGGDLHIVGSFSAASVSGGSAIFSNGTFGVLNVNGLSALNLSATMGTINGDPIATLTQVAGMTVSSFNFRRGDVILDIADILNAGGAPISSPNFQGVPTAPTPELESNNNQLATTAFVQQAVGGYLNYWVQNTDLVTTFNGRSGDVVLTQEDIINAGAGPGGDPFNNTALTGIPTAPTAPNGTDTNQLATTAFVANAVATIDTSDLAPINSPAFSGYVTAPTATPGTSDGQVATTAFVMNAVTASTSGVASFNGRTGAVTLTTADITGAGGAVLSSPTFTGVPSAPTAAPGTNTTQIATTAFVAQALAGSGVVASFNGRTGVVILSTADITGAGGAPISSPALTGTPSAPTAAVGTSTTQLATTAFVANAIAAVGTVVQTFNGRSGAVTLAANDISAAGGAVLASPSFSGVPTAPTATVGNSTSQIATTSFVMTALAGGAGVASFNSRTGAVTLQGGDITGAGGALLASPTFTGSPAGPTASPGTSTTQLATTAFVAAALTSSAVSSFNARTGAVTLQAADITGAGGALLASPGFSGVPTTPTAAATTNTTQIASTAFVQAAINAAGAGVTTFNGRSGAVSLIANDVSAAGGALTASPAFSGTPTAPTPPPTDNSTTVATTAFVQSHAEPFQNRNRLINGELFVNQYRFANGSFAAGAFLYDRWKAGTGGATASAVVGTATLTISAGSVLQIIEPLHVFEGGTYTLSWIGTATARVYQGTATGAYAASPITVTGMAANTATTVEFTGGSMSRMQYELGPTATPYDFRLSSHEFILCQRYYRRWWANSAQAPPNCGVLGLAYCLNATTFIFTMPLPTPMRGIPILSVSRAAGLSFALVGAAVVTTAVSTNINTSQDTACFTCNVAGGLTAGQAGAVLFPAQTDWIDANAEL